MPYPAELSAQHLVAFPRASFSALRGALVRDTGAGYASYLQEAGYAGGETVMRAFRDWLTARGADPPERLSIDAFAAQAAVFFAEAGWGHIDVQPVEDVAATVDANDWAESDPEANFDHPACHFSTGFLADFFGRVADSPLASLEVECRSAGALRCRFIVGSAEVMQHVFERMSTGSDYMSALEELL
jgi:predicted hydrocarbon binding protein